MSFLAIDFETWVTTYKYQIPHDLKDLMEELRYFKQKLNNIHFHYNHPVKCEDLFKSLYHKIRMLFDHELFEYYINGTYPLNLKFWDGMFYCLERMQKFEEQMTVEDMNFDDVLHLYNPNARKYTFHHHSSLDVQKPVTLKFDCVNGDSTSRKAWIKQYPHGTGCVFYVSSLIDYAKISLEVPDTIRLKESLTAFETICKSIHLKKCKWFVFLNKYDIFWRLLDDGITPRMWYNDYQDEWKFSPTRTVEYFAEKFETIAKEHSINVQFIVTRGDDQRSMNTVCNQVLEMVILGKQVDKIYYPPEIGFGTPWNQFRITNYKSIWKNHHRVCRLGNVVFEFD